MHVMINGGWNGNSFVTTIKDVEKAIEANAKYIAISITYDQSIGLVLASSQNDEVEIASDALLSVAGDTIVIIHTEDKRIIDGIIELVKICGLSDRVIVVSSNLQILINAQLFAGKKPVEIETALLHVGRLRLAKDEVVGFATNAGCEWLFVFYKNTDGAVVSDIQKDGLRVAVIIQNTIDDCLAAAECVRAGATAIASSELALLYFDGVA